MGGGGNYRAMQCLGGEDWCACRVQEEIERVCVSFRVSGMLRKSAPHIFISIIGKRLARRFPIPPYDLRVTEYRCCGARARFGSESSARNISIARA